MLCAQSCLCTIRCAAPIFWVLSCLANELPRMRLNWQLAVHLAIELYTFYASCATPLEEQVFARLTCRFGASCLNIWLSLAWEMPPVLAAPDELAWLDTMPRANAAKHIMASVPCCESAASVSTCTATNFAFNTIFVH